MKKLLLAMGFSIITSIGYCGPVDTTGYPAIITNDDVTINWLNNFRSSVVNCLNSFPGDNVQTGTIISSGMIDNANPEVRWGETFNEFVFTGLLPPAGAGLTATTTAGTAYIKNDTTNYMTRVVKDATAHLYTASKDTYIDLSTTGTYTYSAVALGGAVPVVAANSIRLAKVVTNATDVTSVVDLRVLGVQLSTNEDFYIKDLEITGDTEIVTIDSGIVYNGSTRVAKVAESVIVLDTATDYIGGVSEQGTNKWMYIYCNASGTMKFDDTAPSYHDTSGTTQGTDHYLKDGTDYWRKIGKVYLNATGAGEVDIYNVYYGDNTIDLGNWNVGAPWIDGTSYQAKTDGFVCAYSNGAAIAILTDSGNPPTTNRCINSSDTAAAGSVSPVKKGDYWKTTNANGAIHWISLGN